MADYAPLAVTADQWTPIPVADEDTLISIRGGSVLVTNHSAPGEDNGHVWREGIERHVPARDAWKVRRYGPDVPRIYRTALNGNPGAAAPATPPTVTTQPAITGNAATGSTLTLALGAASGTPAPVSAVQWYRGTTAISGATGASYVLAAADEGKTVTANVVWSNSAGSATGTSNGIIGVAANRAPTAGTIPDQTATAGTAFSLNAAQYFSDPDGDTLSYAATGLPSGLAISSAGAISGTPAASGTANVKVTASDGKGGSKDAGFTLTVQAAAPAAPTYSASSGTATGADSNGTRTITVTGGNYPGTYTLTADQTAAQDAGKPVILDWKATRTSGGWTLLPPLILYAAGDTPVVGYTANIGGTETASDGTVTYAGVRAVTATAKVDSPRLAQGEVVSKTITLQAAQVFAPALTRFRVTKSSDVETDNPSVRWDTGSGAANALTGTTDKLLYMASMRLGTPDAQGVYAKSATGNNFAGISLSNDAWEPARLSFLGSASRAAFRLSSSAGFTFKDIGGVVAGDRLDAVCAFGIALGGKVYAYTCLRLTPLASGVPGDWVIGSANFAAGTTFDKTTVPAIRLGGYTKEAQAASLYRSALWLGATADISAPEARALFFDPAAASGLTPPAVSYEALGQPQVDFFEGTNHGTFGAPTYINTALVTL